MAHYVSSMGIGDKLEEVSLLSKWGEIVGDPVAKRTTGLKLIDGILHIELNSSVMRDVLLNTRSLIISRINEMAGKRMVKDIYLK